MKTKSLSSFIVLAFLFFQCQLNARTLFVSLSTDANAWSNITTTAYRVKCVVTTDFSTAFTAMLESDTVLIAKGEYPCSVNINMKTPSGASQKAYLKMYGGFSGSEALASNATLIAGRAKSDIDGNGVVEPWEFTFATVIHRRTGTYANNSIRLISIETMNSSIDGLTLMDNQSTIPNGGAVTALATSSIVQNCIIRNINIKPTANGVSRGGGIYIRQGIVDGCLIEGCSVNAAVVGVTSQYGGGVAIDNTTPGGKIKNSVIRNNAAYNGTGTATGVGLAGGLYMERGSIAENCIIYNNYSQSLGGGIYVTGQGGNLYNLTITNNKAGTNGGGIYVANASVNPTNMYNIAVVGNVIADNSANNIQLFSSTSNTIKLSGYATNGGNTVTQNTEASPVSVTLSSTLTDYFTYPTSFKGISASSANTTEIALARFNLAPNSLLIDAGVNTITGYTLATKDVQGNDRSGTYDIGACEYVASSNVSGTSTSSSFNSGTSSISVASGGMLTIDVPTTTNSVSIESGGKLNTATGKSLNTVNLTLKAGKTTSFSTKLEANINANNVRLFKLIDDQKWYFMSFPCEVIIASITKSDGSTLGVLGTDWFIKYYDGNKRSNDGTSKGTNWKAITNADLVATPSLKLNQYQGYIFGLNNGTSDTELLFPLNTSILAAETTKGILVLSYSAGSAATNQKGWNLVGQPYLSKYASQSSSNAPYMIISDGIGTYTTYSAALGQLPTINPFDAYFIQADAGLQTSGLTFSLAGRQSAPASVTTNVSENIQLNITTDTGADNTYLIMDNEQTTEYQIGQDLEKWIGTGTDKPQVYTTLDGVNYAFNALPISSVVNLPVGFYSKNAGISTISVNASEAPSISSLILTDITTGASTDLLKSNYTFNADAGTSETRFKITAQRVSTGKILQSEFDDPTITSSNGKLIIDNLKSKSTIRIYDIIGRLLTSRITSYNSLEIPISVVGILNIQIENGVKLVNRKVIL